MATLRPVPQFLLKLSDLTHDPELLADLIEWEAGGAAFFVKDTGRFAREVLPRLFKHNNYTSFQRQMHLYGFHRNSTVRTSGDDGGDGDVYASPTTCERFTHPLFQRGREDLLKGIRRRTSKRAREQQQARQQHVQQVQQQHNNRSPPQPTQARQHLRRRQAAAKGNGSSTEGNGSSTEGSGSTSQFCPVHKTNDPRCCQLDPDSCSQKLEDRVNQLESQGRDLHTVLSASLEQSRMMTERLAKQEVLLRNVTALIRNQGSPRGQRAALAAGGRRPHSLSANQLMANIKDEPLFAASMYNAAADMQPVADPNAFADLPISLDFGDCEAPMWEGVDCDPTACIFP